MRARFDPDTPGRFGEDFGARCDALQQRDGVLSVTVTGPFWQLRDWLGFEGLCLLFAEDPDWVEEMCLVVVPTSAARGGVSADPGRPLHP